MIILISSQSKQTTNSGSLFDRRRRTQDGLDHRYDPNKPQDKRSALKVVKLEVGLAIINIAKQLLLDSHRNNNPFIIIINRS